MISDAAGTLSLNRGEHYATRRRDPRSGRARICGIELRRSGSASNAWTRASATSL
jgi:hypothetical protein